MNNEVPTCWILLDNQSTIDVFSNGNLLRNVREIKTYARIRSTAGVSVTNKIGDLPGYGTVWYHPEGVANILSLKSVIQKGYAVSFSSTDGNTFRVKKLNGPDLEFKQSEYGLYYLDTNQKYFQNGFIFINMIQDNVHKLSNQDYSRAVSSRKMQRIIGRPSTKTFMQIVNNNLVQNCPIQYKDIINAENTFGPDLGSLQGKTVRHSPETVVLKESIHLPENLFQRYRNVTVCGDIMYVNKLMFFVTISRDIKFSTAELIKDNKSNTLLNAMKQVINIYKMRGFKVTDCLLDGQFECLSNQLAGLGVRVNITSRNEHVPEIERHIRTVKERARAVLTTLPFKKIPSRMLAELIYSCTFWLNSFPHSDGISRTLSPRGIITGSCLDYKKHCQLEFGEYVHTHEEHGNGMTPRTIGAIALRPTGNAQGSMFFYSIDTGKRINRYKWTPLPMPNDVVNRVEQLAEGNEIHADDLFPVSDDADIAQMESEQELPTVLDRTLLPSLAALPDPTTEITPTDTDTDINDLKYDGTDIIDNINTTNILGADETLARTGADVNTELSEATSSEETPILSETDNQVHTYNLRARQPRNYDHLYDPNTHHTMAQYNLKRGIEVFGDAGMHAIKLELQQLEDRNVLIPIGSSSLNKEEKAGALPYLMFLKEKRSGLIKGRGCADGRKQRIYHSKEEASSPTVSLESVLMTCAIDAAEGRDVATVDIPAAFMQADMDEAVYLRLTGKMIEFITDINPKKYKQFICTENNKNVLYVRLNKALYGTLRASLLFWRKLTKELESLGFVINPYDCCVANKMINNAQCTIVWHVDDLKISHVDANVVTKIIEDISGVFGTQTPLTVHRGTRHEYLGMTLDFSKNKKVSIHMDQYINQIVNEAPKDMEGEASTPACNFLFSVNNTNPTLLPESVKDTFHTIVAKLLFACKRARPDIMTAIAFLCTRVKAPDTDDYKKLGRVIKYLRKNPNLGITLERDTNDSVQWFIDASFGCHNDMKSHTGGIMTLGKGGIYCTSTRQKLNTRSSTESELIGLNDVLPQVIWTRNFLLHQGMRINNNTVFQDNKSAILLEKNGCWSSSKRTKHIDVRYFFVKDRIANGELEIEYCSTNEMLADFFTKPTQGNLFLKLRNQIMNISDNEITS
jgi:hypothetical protein